MVLLVNRAILDLKSEPLFLLLQFSFENLVGIPDRVALEQPLDLLQRNPTSLGNEEEGEEEGKEGQRSKEKVDSIAHGGEHLFGESRDEEVEEPVAGCCGCLSQGTEAGLKEFLFAVSLANKHKPIQCGDPPS